MLIDKPYHVYFWLVGPPRQTSYGTSCSFSAAMSRHEGDRPFLTGPNNLDEAETQSLVPISPVPEPDLVVHTGPTSPSPSSAPSQSAIAPPTPDGQRRAPRTTNRVRFDIEDEESDIGSHSDSHNGRFSEDSSWLDQEDYTRADHGRSDRGEGPRMPLLTDMEAPSVTLATSEDFFPEDHLEDARPRSGMRMAFMNMANSIIGAGIVGQSYALRQSGMVMGIILLMGLTIAVDWTIRLIVINSKLSGADSFQATMQHCFGKGGLIAISIAQWAFAYGGMIAFCIIVGDTIPHVFSSLFPSLREMSFLWLLTDRRAIIVLFVLTISYPLSLYRDIAKVSLWLPEVNILETNSLVVGESVHPGIGQYVGYPRRCNHPGISGSARIARRYEGLNLGQLWLLPGSWCYIIR